MANARYLPFGARPLNSNTCGDKGAHICDEQCYEILCCSANAGMEIETQEEGTVKINHLDLISKGKVIPTTRAAK